MLSFADLQFVRRPSIRMQSENGSRLHMYVMEQHDGGCRWYCGGEDEGEEFLSQFHSHPRHAFIHLHIPLDIKHHPNGFDDYFVDDNRLDALQIRPARTNPRGLHLSHSPPSGTHAIIQSI